MVRIGGLKVLKNKEKQKEIEEFWQKWSDENMDLEEFMEFFKLLKEGGK